jgi:large repetitive protein
MRKLRSKRFRFEALERRCMLAGDVEVTQDNGVLVIEGDDNDNYVIIEGGTAGAVVITGADDTAIFFNGIEQTGPLTLTGGIDTIIVDLNAGDDILEMNNVAVDDLIITMDEGADVVRLGAFEAFAANPGGITAADGSVGVNGALVINTGTGADLVEIVRVFGTANWDIALGDSDGTNNNNDDILENDFAVTLDDQIYVFIGSGETIAINGGTGDDLVNINYLTVNGALVVDGVTGNDVLSVNGSVFNEYVGLFGGSGFDTIAVDFSRHDGGSAATVEINGGADDDFILFARSLVEEGNVVIVAGSGFDDVIVGRYYANAAGDLTTGGNVIGTLSVDTGSDGDFADIRGNDMLDFFGVFAGGDDEVDFVNNIVRDQGLLDGGSGFDNLTFLGNSVRRPLSKLEGTGE